MNMWDEIFARKEWILGLSPMDGVTDVVMRYMVAKYGRPSPQASGGIDVMFTEFVSVDALAHVSDAHKAEQVLKALMRARDVGSYIRDSESQQACLRSQVSSPEYRCVSRPAGWPYEVAQVFGHTPELFYKAAVLVATLGFDGMDINMGCPATKVQELGSGAGLIRTPEVAQEIVKQAKRGIADWVSGKVGVEDLGYSSEVVAWVQNHARVSPLQKSARKRPLIPVSVKTRIGVDRNQVEEWIPAIMEVAPAVLSLHGRTLKQLYQGSADWEAIGRAAELVHSMGGRILGNGDVRSILEAEEKVKQYGVDGVLIGRAAEGSPSLGLASKEQRLSWILEHAKIYDKLFVQTSEPDFRTRAFMPLRKHLAWYASGFPDASELRQKLVVCRSLAEVNEILSSCDDEKYVDCWR